MTDPTPLSPAARAVDRAIADRIQLLGEITPSRQVAAAALRAAVDQVVPEPSDAAKALFSLATVQILYVIRDEFHAIATELENHV